MQMESPARRPEAPCSSQATARYLDPAALVLSMTRTSVWSCTTTTTPLPPSRAPMSPTTRTIGTPGTFSAGRTDGLSSRPLNAHTFRGEPAGLIHIFLHSSLVDDWAHILLGGIDLFIRYPYLLDICHDALPLCLATLNYIILVLFLFIWVNFGIARPT